MTYFTAWVEDDGKLRTFGDVYGHENRIALGVAGKAHLIKQEQQPKTAPPPRRTRERVAPPEQTASTNSRITKGWMRGVFQY